MIEVEVEDDAWTDALPNVEAVVRAAVETALKEDALGQAEPDSSAVNGGAWDSDPPPLSSPVDGGGGAARLRAVTEGAFLAVLLTDDATVQDLNARFRSVDKPTNVLAFPAAPSAAPHIGDVALAFGVCAREAQAQGKPLAHHLAHLTAHGVLHLLGWDHEDEAQAEAMQGRERAILASLGVPDPYAHEHG